MGKIDLEIIESDFNQKYTSTYDLSILIGMDRFSFLVIDEHHRLLVLRNYSWDDVKLSSWNWKERLQQIYIHDDLLKLGFQKINIAIENEWHTLVPQRLFRAADRRVYLEKLFGDLTTQEVFSDPIPGIDAVCVYQMNNEIEQLFHSYFSKNTRVHLCTPILAGFRSLSEQQPGKNIYIYVLDKQLYISYFDDRELIFFNNYNFRSAKDFIYYVLLVFDQFQLKPESIPVHLSGYIVEDSEIYHLLYRYIRLLHWVKPPSNLKFGPGFTGHPPHLYFGLYSLRLCG